jgi:hypothetical protein
MTFFKRLNNAFLFLAEAINRVFSPHDDAYPESGVQPYSGEPRKKGSNDW